MEDKNEIKPDVVENTTFEVFDDTEEEIEGLDSYESENNQYFLEDITEKLPEEVPQNAEIGGIINISSKDIPNEIFDKFNQGRIILIDAPDEKMCTGLGYAVIRRIEKSNPKVSFYKRLKDFKGGNSDAASTFNIDIFIDESIKENIIVVIDIKSHHPQSFIDSLMDRFLMLVRAKEILRKKNIFIIGLQSSSIGAKQLDENDLDFVKWKVPFLDFFLRQYEALDFRDFILRQRKRGHWGDDINSDIIFYKLLTQYKSKQELKAAVDERDSDKFQDEEKKKKTHIKKLINGEKKKQQINKYLLFIGAFFPNLSQFDLSELFSILTSEDRKLMKELDRNFLKYLNVCNLSGIELRFTDNDFFEKVKLYFTDTDFRFMYQQFEKIVKSGLIINGAISPEIRFNSNKLCCFVLSNRENEKTVEFLWAHLVSIIKNKTKVKLDIGEKKIQTLFSEKINDTSNIRKRLRYFSNTLIEILNYNEQLSNIDTQFFQTLFDKKQYRIILDITEILQDSIQFDKLKWIKQILDRGDKDTEEMAYKHLLSLAKQRPDKIFDYLYKVGEWRPVDKILKPDDVSRSSSRYSLRFLQDYTYYNAVSKKFHSNPELYGAYFSSYPLFKYLQLEDNRIEKIDFIMDWLFTENIFFGRRTYKDGPIKIILIAKHRNQYLQNLANLFEQWFFILHGLEDDFLYEENRTLAKQIFGQIPMRLIEFGVSSNMFEKYWIEQRINKFEKTLLTGKDENNKMLLGKHLNILIKKLIPFYQNCMKASLSKTTR